jgi:pyruvate dehydrogenase E2 component (dihydrolipoamide acetyltransferase)
MSYIEMPKLSDTMTEGTVVKWHKSPGDTVEIGDVLADIETDKAVMELEAFEEGVLKETYIAEGGKVQLGQRIALVLGPGEKADPKDKPSTQTKETAPANAAQPKDAAPAKAAPPAAAPDKEPAPADKSAPKAGHDNSGRTKASPLAKKIAGAKGVDLAGLQGTGPGGRVIAKDVDAAAVSAPAQKAGATKAPAAPQADKRIALSGMRKVIAERLLASKTQIPHFYLNIEIDASELLRTRAQINEHLEKSGGGKLSINDLVLKGAVAAAVKVPRVNASFSGDSVIEYGGVHLSVAVAIEDGLVTPVIREAQTKSLFEISSAVKDLATRARTKKLKPEEYQGGTITVSNLGSYGIDSFSAVINPPQAIILAIGAIVKKPVVNAQDQIVAGHRMSIGLSADHRVVDGAIGAQYLAELRNLLENPVLLLL